MAKQTTPKETVSSKEKLQDTTINIIIELTR
jgi:hypothetical protein